MTLLPGVSCMIVVTHLPTFLLTRMSLTSMRASGRFKFWEFLFLSLYFTSFLDDCTAHAISCCRHTIVSPSVCLSVMKCIVAKRYILRQNCRNKWIANVARTRFYNFQLPTLLYPLTLPPPEPRRRIANESPHFLLTHSDGIFNDHCISNLLCYSVKEILKIGLNLMIYW